jgi:DNA-binding transcriptional LysR family regulator
MNKTISPTLDVLQTFLSASSLRSFTAAADELGLTRAMVSKRIAQLEAYVGAPLFHRTTRRVDLTAAGDLLRETLQPSLVGIERGLDAVRDLRTSPSGLVRVTAPISWGQCVLAQLLPRLLDAHPLIEIELNLTDRLVDLAAERFDVAFRMIAAPDQDTVAVPSAPLVRKLYASKAYLSQHSAPRHPRALAAHQLMTYWSHAIREPLLLTRESTSAMIEASSRYRANSTEAVLAATLAGSCIGVLPSYLITGRSAAQALVQVLPSWQVKSQFGESILAVGLPDRIRQARCRAFLDFVRSALSRHSGRP